jgi:hypothetical protein
VVMSTGLLAMVLVVSAVAAAAWGASWWLFVLPAALVFAVVVLISRSYRQVLLGTSDAMAERLALAVRHQWEEEARWRRLNDPYPLSVPWVAAGQGVADRRVGIFPSEVSNALHITGQSDTVAELFMQIPSRRLVLIGPPGSGKTVLAIQLTLELLARRLPGDPVPVLLSIGSWDPTVRSYHGWLVDRLVADYPALASVVERGRSAAEVLVREGRVLPVLDGLDELVEQYRVLALEQLNRSLTAVDAIVLTSRSDEYARLVQSTGVLGRAAVIRLESLARATVVEYLVKSAPIPAAQRLARLLKDEGVSQPLWQVLDSPLMVSLFRAVYSDPSADPEELLDRNRFPDVASIEKHLLRSWGHAAVRRSWPLGFLAPARVDVANADTWLSFLAAHLARSGRHELAWWELDRAAPVWAPAGAGAFLVGAGVGAAVTAGYGPAPGVIAAAVSAIAALGLGVVVARRGRDNPRVAAFPGRRPDVVSRALLMGFAAAAPLALIAMQVTGWVFGAVVGVTLWAGIGVTAWLAGPTPGQYPASATVTLRASQLFAATTWLALALSVGVVWTLVASSLTLDEVTIGLVAAAVTLTWLTTGSAWGRFTVARAWLAARGLLPWRFLKRFVE